MKNIFGIARIFCFAAAVLLFAGCGKSEAERFFEKGNASSDTTEKLKWYEKAAEKGHAPAQLATAEIYWREIEDLEKAEKWFSKAAKSGNKVVEEHAKINLDTVRMQLKTKRMAREFFGERR